MFNISFLQLNVVVDNGLSRYSKDLVIEVSYEKATPVFNTTKYETDVAENADVNTEVLTVIATSQNLIGELIYRVLGKAIFFSFSQNVFKKCLF